MSIDSVSGTYASFPPLPLQRAPEAAEVGKAEPDGDADDGGSRAATPPQAVVPTVNADGQQLGRVINTSA